MLRIQISHTEQKEMDSLTNFFDLENSVTAKRENDILCYVENCKKCGHASYFEQTSYKRVGNKIKTRAKCTECGTRRKETLYCYDYGDIMKYVIRKSEFENYLSVPAEVELAWQHYISKKMREIASGKQNYTKFFRDWLSCLCTWSNTYYQPFFKGILNIKNNEEFITALSHNLFFLWD